MDKQQDPAVWVIIAMFLMGITGVGSALLASNLKQADTINQQNQLILELQKNSAPTTINNTTINNTRNCQAIFCK